MQCGILRRADSEGGANMVMSDILYMWSEMDSPLGNDQDTHLEVERVDNTCLCQTFSSLLSL